MDAKLVRLRKGLAAKVKAHEDFMGKGKVGDEYDPPNSELGITSAEFGEKVRAQIKEIEDLRKGVDDYAEIVNAEHRLKTLRGNDLDSATGLHDDTPPEETTTENKSVGRLFVESEAFKDYRPGADSGPLASVKLSDKGVKTLFQRTDGWSPESTRTGVVSMYPTRPAPQVVNFIPEVPTMQAAYVYMEETTYTNAATEIAEGGTYPEAALQLTQRTQPVQKIAVWLPVTDEQIEDEPQVEAYIDQRLRLMLSQRLDAQVLVGNGTAPNLLGTSNVSGIQSQAKGSDSLPDAVRKLFTEIRSDGFADPNVAFIHPKTWQDIALLKTADGSYIWGHPSTVGPTMLWGVNMVETTAISESLVIAGDYQTHSLLAMRRGVDMQITNSHGTFFTEGKRAIRLDLRCCLVHLRPKAFGEVTGANA